MKSLQELKLIFSQDIDSLRYLLYISSAIEWYLVLHDKNTYIQIILIVCIRYSPLSYQG